MKPPIHIAMLESGGWGGIGHYTYNLCQALARTGCRVTLITGTPYELQNFPRGFRLEAVIPPDAPYLQKLQRTARCLRVLRPDLLHIQSTFSARRDWFSLIALKVLQCPVVFTTHDILPLDAEERNARGMRLAYNLIYALSGCIIVHSKAARRELLRLFRPSPSKIAVIPHGDYTFVDMEDPIDPDSAKRWLGIGSRHRVILAFGAIREYKGIPDLIEAFARVVHTVPDVHLAIVGKPIGIDPESYRAHIQRLGLEHRVIFRPEYVPIEDIGRYFQAADIAVFPYRAICQSGALQLAYAFGKPVVVTQVGGFPETVEEGRNSLVVPPGAPCALADALQRLLSLKPAALMRMGQISLELARTRYSWDEIATKTSALYTKILL